MSAATVTRVPVAMDARGIKLQSLDDAIRFANGLIDGGLAPKGLTKPGAVVAVIQAGAEIGLSPMWALSQITFTNGRLGIMGDAAVALVRRSGVLDRSGVSAVYSGEEMTPGWTCSVTIHRTDAPAVTRSFSLGEAIRAGLVKLAQDKERGVVLHTYKRSDGGGWGLWDAPWSRYPQRMLYYRALGFACRDGCSDILLGLGLTEELNDYPRPGPERDVTPPAAQPAAPDPLLRDEMQEFSPGPGGHDADDPLLDREDAPGRAIDAEVVHEPPKRTVRPGTPQQRALEAVPACGHPEGFSEMASRPGERVCFFCGEVAS